MRIALMSDLHFECYPDRGTKFIRRLEPEDIDVLILAGDIMPVAESRFEEVIESICEKYSRVIYVPGNHEYYGSDTPSVDYELRELELRIENLDILDNSVVYIDGQRFVGGTMWFKDPGPGAYRQGMADFSCIRYLEPWVYLKNQSFADLASTIRPEDVVVTHHLPTWVSVAPRFAFSRLNPFFVNDMSDLIQALVPRIWIHGHTHDRLDYRLGATRILCNARGYPGERPGFDPELVIDV